MSLDLLNRIVDSLDVRAPIDGFLSSIDAEIGENIVPGRRIGQIDQLDAFKLRARIDQYYLSRVEVGTPGKIELDGKTYAVAVKRIYPEVVNDAFTVDIDFDGRAAAGAAPRPAAHRSSSASALRHRASIVERGGFMQHSGGRWVYLVAEDGALGTPRAGAIRPAEPALPRSARGPAPERPDRDLELHDVQRRRRARIHGAASVLNATAAGSPMIIETQDLKKLYRTELVETTALDAVNFSVDAGQFVSIMGPSGCGKSTLLHILGLIDTPSDGSYRFLGEDVSRYPESRRAAIRKRNIGFVFQSFNLIDELTVYENVELPLVYAKTPARERQAKVDAVLERMDIGHRRDHLPGAALGRPAAARRGGARGGQQAEPDPRRRAHRQSRFRARRRSHEELRQAARGRHEHRDGHALARQRRVRRAHGAHARRPDPGRAAGRVMKRYLKIALCATRAREALRAAERVGTRARIACCLMLGLYLWSELTYDRHHVNHERIYRIATHMQYGDGRSADLAITSSPFGPMLAAEYPDTSSRMSASARSRARTRRCSAYEDQKAYWKNVYLADENVFDVFTHEIVYGDPRTALSKPASIAISRRMAQRYFGNENPVGRVLTMDEWKPLNVTLVFEELPELAPALRRADLLLRRRRRRASGRHGAAPAAAQLRGLRVHLPRARGRRRSARVRPR